MMTKLPNDGLLLFALSISDVAVREIQLDVLEVAVQVDYEPMFALSKFLLDTIELMLLILDLLPLIAHKNIILKARLLPLRLQIHLTNPTHYTHKHCSLLTIRRDTVKDLLLYFSDLVVEVTVVDADDSVGLLELC